MNSAEVSEQPGSTIAALEKEYRELEGLRTRHERRGGWWGTGAGFIGLLGAMAHERGHGWVAFLLYAASVAWFGLATAHYARSRGQSPKWGRWSLLGMVIVSGREDIVGERLDRLRKQVPEKQASKFERTTRLAAAFGLPCFAIIYYLGDWQLPNDDPTFVLLCLAFATFFGISLGVESLITRARAGITVVWAIIAVLWSGGWLLRVGADLLDVKENPPTTTAQRTIKTIEFSGLLPPGWRTIYRKSSEPGRFDAEHEQFELSLTAVAQAKDDFGDRSLEEIAEQRLEQEKAKASSATWYGKRIEQSAETRRLAYTFHRVTGSRDEVTSQYHFWRSGNRNFVLIGEGPTKNVLEHQDELKRAMDSVRSK